MVEFMEYNLGKKLQKRKLTMEQLQASVATAPFSQKGGSSGLTCLPLLPSLSSDFNPTPKPIASEMMATTIKMITAIVMLRLK